MKWATAQSQTIQNKLIKGFQEKTPVRTGRAKAGWESTATISKMGDTGVIENNVPYIGWLEFGSDTVAPQSMVRSTVQALEQEYK